MSHTIIPFIHSNLLTIEGNTFLIKQEEPVYTPHKLVTYNFDTRIQEEIVFPKSFQPFLEIFHKNPAIEIKYNWEVIDGRKTAKKFYESPWKEQTEVWYENIDVYPKLKIFLGKKQSHPRLIMYGDREGFTLDIWNDQAYVVSNAEDEITAYHIDEEYYLQEGNRNTYVLNFDNNFVVYNEGDVYSVVLVVKNQDVN